MITIHEFGHYIAGKLLGFKIDEFSIGFGPKLFQKKKKNGELFSIRLLPLGGYCAFAGESDEEKVLAPEKLKKEQSQEIEASSGEQSDNGETKAQSTAIKSEEGNAATDEPTDKSSNLKKFNDQPPWKRIIVLMAGGVFNILSAVIFSFIFIAAAGAGTPTLDGVLPDAPTATSVTSYDINDIEPGDKVYAVDGQKVDFYHNFSELLANKELGQEVVLTVIRNGEKIDITTKIRHYLDNENNDCVGLGVSLHYNRASIGEAFKYCVPYTAKLSWLILGTFWNLITGKVPLNQVSGPVGTVTQMADYGMQNANYLLLLMPLIAANLGIFNLFPIPALDGSKVVFTIIEWIRGKRINPKVENTIHFVGLIVLLGLVVLLDIVNFILRLTT